MEIFVRACAGGVRYSYNCRPLVLKKVQLGDSANSISYSWAVSAAGCKDGHPAGLIEFSEDEVELCPGEIELLVKNIQE
jgi:hypothetical protein